MENYSRAAAFIYLDAIYDNLKALKDNTKAGTKLCAVIKTDGYGHGAVPIAKRIRGLADFFAVATVEEAFNLRRHQVEEPILVLGHTQEEAFTRAIKEEIRLNVYDYETAERLSQAAVACKQTAYIHIKVETGMNRLGFQPGEQSLSEVERIVNLPGIFVEGLFSHYSRADETDKQSAEKQHKIFSRFEEELSKRGIEIPVKHTGNSAVIIDLPQYDGDMVRAGIALYGMYPSDEVDMGRIPLRPALSLKAKVIYVKTIRKGEAVGYGGTFVAERDTRLATIAIGYGDGYPRNLSNKGDVLLHGQRAPIAGRVCMDQLMVDVTDLKEPVKVGDEAVLVGFDGKEHISVEELAALAGTFNYEFVCDLGKRIPRIYLSGGHVVGKKDYFEDDYQIRL